MPFDSPYVAVQSFNDRLWVLNVDLVYTGGQGDSWRVPTGFMTDFASVPWFLHALINSYGRWTQAAILHDWFCTIGIAEGSISARDADGVFRRTMREGGVPPVMRWLMWTGVRWGAAFNRIRRPGWWRDAPAVLGISVLALVPALVLTVPTLAVWLVYRAAELAAWIGGGGRPGR